MTEWNAARKRRAKRPGTEREIVTQIDGGGEINKWEAGGGERVPKGEREQH